jgi:glycosyltransferase involved in cell wall biosynthesis
MKILLINNFHYYRGGSERVYFNTANVLKENGHEVVFFSMKDENTINCEQSQYFCERKICANGSTFNKIFYFWDYFYNKRVAKNLNSLLLHIKPDIAHVHLIWGGLTASILSVLRKHGVPIVHTVHDYRLICPAYLYLDGKGRICESCKTNKYFMCWLKKCSKNSFIQSMLMCLEMYFRNIVFKPSKMFDAFIFPSDFVKKKHFEYFPDLKKKRCVVLPNMTALRSGVSVEKEGYILYYGRLSPEKGIPTLLKTVKKISDINPGIKLIVIGEGKQETELKEYAINNKMENVFFMGFKYGKELNEFVRKARFVIIPSEWYENNPMSIIESYSLGTPVIGSDIGGIPEIVKDKETGYLFEPYNAEDLYQKIQMGLSLPKDGYMKLCHNAHEFARTHFSEESYYNKLIKCYTAVIDNS